VMSPACQVQNAESRLMLHVEGQHLTRRKSCGTGPQQSQGQVTRCVTARHINLWEIHPTVLDMPGCVGLPLLILRLRETKNKGGCQHVVATWCRLKAGSRRKQQLFQRQNVIVSTPNNVPCEDPTVVLVAGCCEGLSGCYVVREGRATHTLKQQRPCALSGH